jgi:lysozyme
MAADAVYMAMEFIKPFEGGPDGGFAAVPYLCPAGKLTIGWGHVIKQGEQIKTPLTKLSADALLRADAIQALRAVRNHVTVNLTESMEAALISFVFNLGAIALVGSTLLKKLNASDYQGAADEFIKWNKARNPRTGKLRALSGLTRRRQAERELFISVE